MDWSEERVAELKRLWATGLSARQIAEQLGGVTRNAVIGKAHRLGLSQPSPIARSPIAQRTRPPPEVRSGPGQDREGTSVSLPKPQVMDSAAAINAARRSPSQAR